MPFCKYLTEKDKENFHNEVDRTSTKTKLSKLLEESENFYDVMKHENSLRPIFRKYGFLAFLNSMENYWEPIAFVNAILCNIWI